MMLKYIAIVAVIIAGYFYLDKPKASPAALPKTPETRSIARVRNPKTEPASSNTVNTPTAISSPVVLNNKDKSYTYPEIQKMIANDDVCALHKLVMDTAAKTDPPIYVDALFEALNMERFKPIFGVEGPLFKAQDGKPMTPDQKFLDALVTSEMMYGVRREQNDMEKSLKQLEELSAAYPDNAAYALYKLTLERQMGKTPTQLRGTVAAISKTKSYNTGLFDVRTELHKHMWTSPSLYYLTRQVVGELPGARFHKVRDVVLGIEDPKAVEHLGTLLVQKGLNSRRTHMSEEFDSLEYYYGNSFLNNKHPDVNELAETKEPGKIQEINDSWEHYELDHENCDRAAFDEAFEKMKNRF